VKYRFASVASERVAETAEEALKHIYEDKRLRLKWNPERGMRSGMQIGGDGLALGNLSGKEAAQLRAMGKGKAKGGAMFETSQQIINPGGLDSPATPSAPSPRASQTPMSRWKKAGGGRRAAAGC